MAWLSLYVRYLGTAYHGAEWPPSPFKVMQAIVAGFNQGRDRSRFDADFEAAIRWFEQQIPVWIDVPEVDEGLGINLYVPNNEDNLTMKELAAGNPHAVENRRERYSEKVLRQRFLQQDKPLGYHWAVDIEGIAHAARIADYAKSITALGLGIDMVIAWGEININQPSISPHAYCHTNAGNVAMRIPRLGSYVSLEARYHAKFMGKASSAWINFGTARYQRADQPTGKPYIAFQLLELHGKGFWVRDARQTNEVAAMMRHVVCRALMQELETPEEVAQWMGHGDVNGERLHILPLPSIGHEHVDGLIRRVLVTGADAELLERLAWTLEGSELLKDGQPIARLVRIFGDDTVVGMYTGEWHSRRKLPTCEWVSVTPVVMPGFDHHGKRTDKLMREALKQAGLPEPLEMEVSAAPYQRHGHRAGSYAVPNYLKYPQYHVRIRWEKPQYGALAIGAGRFRGLGLLYPVL
ncbi:type I-U CRISPR-associated protein Csb2 [Thiothrix unzii]|uniref:type I-G CRISPR-associated protein Csb2 n=1 Tax=Thiothrix unzii TaxID=111769 RepID=UPI002A3631C5|nr:type I-U CRISPR-associated protein Csb2 [Thiothrix unzii]MDX9990395.1 type I-U CRISPR-associated protein Csb2 [Thiothrix unzii]